MHFLGCPSSTAESLEEACLVQGVPVQELNNHILKQGRERCYYFFYSILKTDGPLSLKIAGRRFV